MTRHRWLWDVLTYSRKGTTLVCKVSISRAKRSSHWSSRCTMYSCRKWL